jgi:hypothetical protein
MKQQFPVKFHDYVQLFIWVLIDKSTLRNCSACHLHFSLNSFPAKQNSW